MAVAAPDTAAALAVELDELALDGEILEELELLPIELGLLDIA